MLNQVELLTSGQEEHDASMENPKHTWAPSVALCHVASGCCAHTNSSGEILYPQAPKDLS